MFIKYRSVNSEYTGSTILDGLGKHKAKILPSYVCQYFAGGVYISVK